MINEAKIGAIVVSGQPTAEEVRRFGTIVNVRMPDETGNATARYTAATSINYHAVPLTADTLSEEDIKRAKAAIAGATGEVLIHCQGGTRAAVVAAIIEAERAGSGAAGARELIARGGFDIEGRPYGAFIDRYFSG